MQEYNELNAKRRDRLPAPLWVLLAPDPDEFYRWRVQLDCGCIIEVWTSGKEKLPAERQWSDPVHKAWLPAGQTFCHHDDAPTAPYRDITEWGDRREVAFPADPVEPRHGLDPETWALIRHDEPHTSAFWTVTLACGHVTEVATDVEWKPADGPKRVSAERLRKMIAEFEADPGREGEREHEHEKRMLTEGWPRPAPEHLCYTCPRARSIVAYQRIGWLVPRKPEPKPPKPPSRATLERRLKEAEAETERLREQLTQLDAEGEDQ
ncbi:hypothetical protein ACTWP5_10530 [Streptomyces sp. 4N509B]|uniref:hypothetical protein n=1 Tax=Streptomyces sp. 4N509B TaxID=3457413 RepID=UPI003FD0306B